MAQQTLNTPRDTTLLATNTAIGAVAKDATLQATNTALGNVAKDATLLATNSALANLAKDGTLSGVAKDTTLAATNTALGSLAKDATITATNTALGLLGKDASLQDIKTALLSIVSALSPVASGVGFTNTGTGLVSTDVQGALEELDGRQIAADTSTVEDKNGVAVVDRLVYGQKVTAGSVSPSSPLLHQSDIVDDLVTQDATKPLSARQGALLNSNLAELISYSDVAIGNITTTAGGYADIQRYLPTKSGYTLLFVQVQDYGQGKGALSVDVAGRYISGTPSQTWTNVTLRYFFIKNLANA